MTDRNNKNVINVPILTEYRSVDPKINTLFGKPNVRFTRASSYQQLVLACSPVYKRIINVRLAPEFTVYGYHMENYMDIYMDIIWVIT